MPFGGPAPVRGRRWMLAPLLTFVLCATSGCTGATVGDDGPAAPSTAAEAGPTVSVVERNEHLRSKAQTILDRRARAVRDGDLRAFLVDVDRSDKTFVAHQKRYFRNLQELPLEVFDYYVETATWNPNFAEDRWEDDAYIPYVQQRVQLEGFDRLPVTSTFGITFVGHKGQLRIVSDSDVDERVPDGVREAPWDLTGIEVVRTDGVLGIFDKGSMDDSADIMEVARHSIGVVADAIPAKWDKTVVVYALSNRDVLSRMGGIPGGDSDNLSALAFPVFDSAENPRAIVSTRVIIHPEYLTRIDPDHDFLLVHELTHVATARVAGGGPIWVSEGLADYVATRGAAPDSWGASPETVRRAREGVNEMPSSHKFNTVDAGWHYQLALMASDYIAEEFGEDTLWDVFLAMQKNQFATTDEQQDRVLRRHIGMDSAKLADRAARHLVESAAYYP